MQHGNAIDCAPRLTRLTLRARKNCAQPVARPARVFKMIGFHPSARLALRLRRASNAKLRTEIANPPEIRLGNGCTVKPKVQLRIVERLGQDGGN